MPFCSTNDLCRIRQIIQNLQCINTGVVPVAKYEVVSIAADDSHIGELNAGELFRFQVERLFGRMTFAMSARAFGTQYIEAMATDAAVIPSELQDVVVVGERERFRCLLVVRFRHVFFAYFY